MAAAARSWDDGRQRVLALARDAEGAAVDVRAHAHRDMVEGAEQPVVHHRVDDPLVTEAVAGPGARQQVGRPGHRLHAAGDDDGGLAGADHEVGEVDGVQAGEADLVDRRGGRHHRDAGADGCLAGGDLALAGAEHLAHHDVVDVLGGDAGPSRGRP